MDTDDKIRKDYGNTEEDYRRGHERMTFIMNKIKKEEKSKKDIRDGLLDNMGATKG